MDLVENRLGEVEVRGEIELDAADITSLIYHDIFDYPLTMGEITKWKAGRRYRTGEPEVRFNQGFYHLAGKEGIILKRLLRERISARKMEIARKAGQILKFIPTLKMVGVTGALAMGNAGEESDVDLLLVTRKRTLWTTRLATMILLSLFGIKRRKYGEKEEKDKLCLNLWLDEDSLAWSKKDRNIYTAHEICQIQPLFDKEKTFARFLAANGWVKAFWPNAVKIFKVQRKVSAPNGLFLLLEPICRAFQFWYMRGKVTREVVGKGKALFHPNDWGEAIALRLAKWNITP
jgi:predicted nucleotidyltransferase